MELHLLELLSEYGYFGMFLLIMIENIFPPIPSEAVLSFGGFLTEHTELNLQGMLIAATAGSLAGAVILYWAGRIIPLNRLDHILTNRWIQKAGFKEGDIQKTLTWFDRHENKAVFFGRCIPMVRSLISIPAGMNHMPFPRFLLYTTAGSGIWNLLLLALGKKAGSSWYKITQIFDQYSAAILTLTIAITILYIAYKLSTTKKKD